MYKGMRHNLPASGLVALGCLLNHSGIVVAQTAVIDLAVDDARPVSRAIDEFIKQDPYLISYEDPRYEYSGDVRDVTEEIGAARPGATRVIVPAGGTLDLRQLPITAKDQQSRISSTERKVVAGQALRQIVEMQASRNSGGRFVVEQSDQMLHVVPAFVRNDQGEWIALSSILKHEISIGRAERSAVEMLNEICSAVTEASGIKVVFASGPLRALHFARSIQEADNEPARDVLIRTLGQAGGHMTWKLWYGPSTPWYILNIVAVPQPVEPKQPSTSPSIPADVKPPGIK